MLVQRADRGACCIRLDGRAVIDATHDSQLTSWVESANDPATGDFAHVNLSAAWKPLRGNENLTVMLQANNLLDAEGRRHASFTKDFVPLAGRNVKLSVRLSI